MRLTNKQLQQKLDVLVEASREARAAREAIQKHCIAVYGVDPADVDNDEFIDACDGEYGSPAGVSVEQFDRSMRECADRTHGRE